VSRVTEYIIYNYKQFLESKLIYTFQSIMKSNKSLAMRCVKKIFKTTRKLIHQPDAQFKNIFSVISVRNPFFWSQLI